MGNFRADDRSRPPAVEPEIIPPGRADPRWRPAAQPEQLGARQRVFIAPPGPLGIALGLIGLAAFVAIGMVAFLGLFLILIPALGVMIAGFILAALLRGPRRR